MTQQPWQGARDDGCWLLMAAPGSWCMHAVGDGSSTSLPWCAVGSGPPVAGRRLSTYCRQCLSTYIAARRLSKALLVRVC